MLEVENVSKSFGGRTVVRSVSLKMREGEVAALVGPSGAGKSVLLKLIGSVLEPDAGKILRSGGNEDDMKTVGFLFQEGALFDSMSVIENVAFPLLGAPAENVEFDAAMERAFAMLREVGLAAAYRKMPEQLSGGMRRRVALARALVARPDLVLLDDPTGGLDPVAASVIMNLIAKLHAHYRPTVIMVSHDIRRLLPSVERVFALFHGTIVADERVGGLETRAAPEVVKFLATRYDFSTAPGAR